jgi:23S rRNA pseudouridine955/2504/2580 synthase
MREIVINKNEAGQRFDKFLFKYLKDAPAGFVYKMLRKKNIVLNNKKSTGREKLAENDVVKIFMSEDTINKFIGDVKVILPEPVELEIVYEDDNFLFVNKPAGMLTQKAEPKDVSLNEYLLSYLVNSNQINLNQLKTFKPSVCNRLDRNTSGLVTCGKTLSGTQFLAECFKTRALDKYYYAIVKGKINNPSGISGYLIKDQKTNKVTVSNQNIGEYIETEFEPINTNGELTLLKVHLITGKTHQIRAHLASINHPIIGDYKYGDKKINDFYKKRYNISSQMLHAYMIKFYDVNGVCANLSNKEFVAEPPLNFKMFNLLK